MSPPATPTCRSIKQALALVVVALSLALVACGRSGGHGSTGRSAAARSADVGEAEPARYNSPALMRLRGDQDDDDNSTADTTRVGNNLADADADFDAAKDDLPGYWDGDDGSARRWGHEPTVAEANRLTGLVRRYYAVAATGNGAGACALTAPRFAATIVEDYGRAAGPAYSRGSTCAIVLSKLFAHLHDELSGAAVVSAVRVLNDQARVFVGSTTMRAKYVGLEHGRGGWEILGILGFALP